jgi:hypothetical protein
MIWELTDPLRYLFLLVVMTSRDGLSSRINNGRKERGGEGEGGGRL